MVRLGTIPRPRFAQGPLCQRGQTAAPLMRSCGITRWNYPGPLYGDRINEKPGINWDSAGRHEKTRYFSGKRHIFNRDRLASGAFFLGQLETGTSAAVGVLFSCPGRPRKGPGRRRAAGRTRGPRSPKSRSYQAIQGRRAAPPAPEVSSSSRRKRTGFAAHGEIIADGPEKRKRASRANGGVNRAENNAGAVKTPVLRVSITAIAPGRSVTRRYSSCADERDAGPRTPRNEPETKGHFPQKRRGASLCPIFKGF